METTSVFDKLVDAYLRNPRYIDSEGGTRSGKTYSVLQLLILIATSAKKPLIISVVSETLPHLKKGAIRDFKVIMSADGMWDDERWNKTDGVYTFRNGTIIEFFSADSPAKVHGPARDILFINECQNIPYETARQLFVRTRLKVILDYNPTHSFWVNEKIKPRDNCISIHSTYKDNDFLTSEQIAEIESNKDDKNWWRVYGEGKVGVLEGVVYNFEQIDSLPDDLPECYGMDFGFTNDPTAGVHIKADTGRKILYVDEVCYKTGMLNSDIVTMLESQGVPKRSVPIYADCAEPKSIAEIGRGGFNVKPCTKGAPTNSDKLRFQIQWMQGWRLYVTKTSLNLIKELRNYTWAKDKDGNMLNYPIDIYNHLLDALRYGAYTHWGGNVGQYRIRIR